MDVARTFNIQNRVIFTVVSTNTLNYFDSNLKATSTQDSNGQYGEILTLYEGMRKLGY